MRDESEGTVTVCKRLVCVCVSAYALYVCTHTICVYVSLHLCLCMFMCVWCVIWFTCMYPLDESTEATQREHYRKQCKLISPSPEGARDGCSEQ